MRKWCIVICCVLMLSGCQQNKKEEPSVQLNGNKQLQQEFTKENLVVEGYVIDEWLAYDNVIVIYYVNEKGQNKICTYDASNYELLNEIETNYGPSISITKIDNVFYINDLENIYVYDYELNIINTICLDFVNSYRKNTELIALSSDQTRIVYVIENNEEYNIKVKNLDSGQEEVLYTFDLQQVQVHQLVSVDTLFFDTNHVAFVGHYFKTEDVGIPSVQVYGTINIHDKSITYHERDYINTKNVNGYMFIYDREIPDMTYLGTKNVDIYDFEQENLKTVNLTSSYSGFHVDVLSPNMLISYNDLWHGAAKVIIYKDGREIVVDTELPSETNYVSACYIESTETILIWYFEGDDSIEQKLIEIVVEDV